MVGLWLAAVVVSGVDFGALDDAAGWREVATRSSEFGPVVVRHKRVGEVDCLAGTMTVDVAPESLLDVVLDVPSSTAWSSADLRVSEVLSSSSGALRFWQQVDVPNWTLVADRFWVLEGRAAELPDGKRFHWRRVEASSYPAVVSKAQELEAGAIEPPENWGDWTFRRVGATTEVRYRACADVGGSLPDGVQRWVATRTLPDTVSDVVREARRRQP